MPTPIQEGEILVLLRSGASRTLVRAVWGPQTLRGEGVVDLSEAIGQPEGHELRWAGASYRLVRPSLADRIGAIRRKAQIVIPKDAAQLVGLAGVGPGQRVAEAGAGSGALTVTLAHFVGPSGKVYTFDRRADFLDVARQNVEAAGFADRVEFRELDVGAAPWGLDGLDAVLLDLPEPWSAVPSAVASLRIGGYLATYTPTYNQLERTVAALRTAGLGELRSMELLERGLHVGEGGTRPEFEMLGHTGFLSVGRREG